MFCEINNINKALQYQKPSAYCMEYVVHAPLGSDALKYSLLTNGKKLQMANSYSSKMLAMEIG